MNSGEGVRGSLHPEPYKVYGSRQHTFEPSRVGRLSAQTTMAFYPPPGLGLPFSTDTTTTRVRVRNTRLDEPGNGIASSVQGA